MMYVNARREYAAVIVTLDSQYKQQLNNLINSQRQ